MLRSFNSPGLSASSNSSAATLSASEGVANSVDREFFQRELDSFVPEKVFDAHCHVSLPGTTTFSIPNIPASIGLCEYIQLAQDLHPGRHLAALFLGFGVASRPESANELNAWLASQVACDHSYRGAFFVRPSDDPEWVRQEVRRLGLHGLKCYHTFASVKPTLEAHIPDYLPEPFVKVADEEGWTIMLHIVRSRACADAGNIYWIRRYCEQYPRMKLILAHSARGFQPAHNLEGLSSLKGLDNLYFDTSANCEPLAHQSILRIFGHRRLLYGSDLPISHMRGRSVSIGDSFFFVDEKNFLSFKPATMIVEPVLLGLEHLRSLKWACWSERLNDQQIEDIFWNNASQLFDIEPFCEQSQLKSVSHAPCLSEQE